MVQAGHHNQKFVCYPISRAHAEKGEALINWICDLHMGDGAMLPREDWNRPGKLADFLPRFESWKFDWLDVPGVIRAAHAILRIPHGRSRSAAALVARPDHAAGRRRASDVSHRLQRRLAGDPRRRGDHPGTFGRRRSGSGALQRYEQRRLPPTARIVESNRRKGIDVMLDIVEQRAPQGFSNLETVLPAEELERIVADYKKLAAQDRETLLKMAVPERRAPNKKPALLRDRPW